MQFIPTPVAAVILVALFALAGLLQTNAEPFGPGSGQPNGQTSAPQTSTRILEDDPRWNCTTMGNRQCGPAAAAPEEP